MTQATTNHKSQKQQQLLKMSKADNHYTKQHNSQYDRNSDSHHPDPQYDCNSNDPEYGQQSSTHP